MSSKDREKPYLTTGEFSGDGAALRPLKSRPELLLVRMEVVSCSAVACSSRTDRVKFGQECSPSPPSLCRTPPLVAATNVTGSSSWFQRNLPHSFWLSVEGEQL